MKKYYPRIADTILEKKLRSKGAVLVEGPKWCGKSTTCEQQAKSAVYMQDTETREQNIALAYTSPRTFLAQEPPFLIDEWQEAPILWDAIRYEIDKRDEFGQFILTGSTTPLTEQAKKEIKHTGIGRITRMKMNTMSLSESNDSNGTVSLSELFKGMPIAATCRKTLQDYAFILCRGGWPKAIGLEEDIALEQAKDYYEQLIDIGETLQENENDLFEEEDLRYFKIFTDKSERLSNNAQLLCDNLIHLREALDATLNYNLNNTMKLFTMVTIIFQPLTLIVGWYGMNFTNMPELGWKFGYLYVILLCLAVAGAILYYFKKKKYWQN